MHRMGMGLAVVGASVVGLSLVVPPALTWAPANAVATSHSSSKRVIIILRDQGHGLTPSSADRRVEIRVDRSSVIGQLHAIAAQDVVTTSVPNAVIATISPGQIAALASNPAVAHVVLDGIVPAAAPATGRLDVPDLVPTRGIAGRTCGTPSAPELDPEALSLISATPADLGSIRGVRVDGRGVTVATLADGVDPNNPDLLRVAKGAQPAHVVTQVDFSGDGAAAVTQGGEAFGDASSIAAQGNQRYDLSAYVSRSNPLPKGCDIRIMGVARGVDLLALKVYAQSSYTTTSGFIEAIDYAVMHDAKVINESFGSNDVPDTTLNLIRGANDAAVAAGVTVVASTGDAGVTSTIGSPATDPKVISVGATTSFRAYVQDKFGGANGPVRAGKWADNNISALSSGGFNQVGGTVDLVAPGDLNWALCTADASRFTDCTDDSGRPASIQLFGGTSESAPLTAGAAADVIQAYAATHNGIDPSPATVKEVLMSTATDIGARATEQGAGLLNVAGAVALAESLPGTSAALRPGVMVSPGQINVLQSTGHVALRSITLTNAGSVPITVHLSTRALTTLAGDASSSFCMQPGPPTVACPANTGVFTTGSGGAEVYQSEHFTVPGRRDASLLRFSADYTFTGQTALLNFALFEPDGTYAAYSFPQGLANFGSVEVAHPPPGRWTALFFTAKDVEYETGTSGRVQWDARTLGYAPAGTISPAAVRIPASSSIVAHLFVTSPGTPGDSEQAVVVASPTSDTTVPVTVRTLIPIAQRGGTFSGTLTGGNGRGGAPAQTNTYEFVVPRGTGTIQARVTLSSDPGETLVASLIDPSGQTVGYSSNTSFDRNGGPISTRSVSVFHVAPRPGMWSLILDWINPVSGLELTEPFTGTIRFSDVPTSNDLPHGTSVELTRGVSYSFHVRVRNVAHQPEAIFLDARLNHLSAVTLDDQCPPFSAADMALPGNAGGSIPCYFVPTHTTRLSGSIRATAPVTFDLQSFPGNPDVSPAVAAPSVTETQGGHSASLTIEEHEVSPGFWLLDPAEIGPYPQTGAPPVSASAAVRVVTQAFDTSVTSATGDLWSAPTIGLIYGPTFGPFSPNPVLIGSRGSTTIAVTITPRAAPGATVSGVLYVDDLALNSSGAGPVFPNGDELAKIPYTYKVSSTAQGYWTASRNGGVHHFGAGSDFASAGHGPSNSPIVAMATTADRGGYWLATATGRVFGYGDAPVPGSSHLASRVPVTGIAGDATGSGYWLVTEHGQVFSFGDARSFGSWDYQGRGDVVGIARTCDGRGYWLVTASGQVLRFGDAANLGSPAASKLHLASKIVGLTTSPDARGYWLVSARGHVYAYGDARFRGSLDRAQRQVAAVGLAPTPDGKGYWIFTAAGQVYHLGDAKGLGSPAGLGAASGTTAASSAN